MGGGADRHPQRPRTGAVFTKAQGHSAAARPAQAEADIFKRPFVAALLIVDDKVAVLQTDFVEVLSIKAAQAEAVEPIEAGQQSVLGVIDGARRRAGRRIG